MVAIALTGCANTDPEANPNTPETERTVTILGVVVGDAQEKLEAALAPFEAETGIKVIYEGTDAFATLLPVRVDSGEPPDIAMFPQPGLMKDFAESGDLQPIGSFMDRAQLTQDYGDDWLRLASWNGDLYGVWLRASVKSLVWYSPRRFQAQGYEIPRTWEEMMALGDRMVADGTSPWCVGLDSGDATGWVGTDWVEDILLRTAGPEVYDQWVNHEIPFNAPEVATAFNLFGEIVRNPDYVNGGYVGAISTPFGDSPRGLFTDPPRCYLHRQANFIVGFFPQDLVFGEDVDAFPLPPIAPEWGTPILVAGDVFGMFNDTPETRALMLYLATPTPHEIWAELGEFLSPHNRVSLAVYPNELIRKQAEILTTADTIRFDGSDLMPGEVGTGSFWSGVVDYVGGDDLDTVLETIESSWPQD